MEADCTLAGESRAIYREEHTNGASDAFQSQSGADCAQNRRVYQNQRRQRWRARKKEEKRTKEIAAAKEGIPGFSTHYGSLTHVALHEFKRLGKAKEAELKLRLNKLASLSILPGGYSKHSEAVFTLSEDIVMLLRGGRPSLADSAEKMLAWAPSASASWQLSGGLSVHLILEAFLAGHEKHTSVDLTLPNETYRRPITLASFSQMHCAVYMELYAGYVSRIQQYVPMVVQGTPISSAAREMVSKLIHRALVSFVIMRVSQSHTFSWEKQKAPPCPPDELAYIWSALRVSKERAGKLLNEWSKARSALLSHAAAQQKLEDELGVLLEAHDESTDASYVSIITSVKRLAESFEKEVAIRLQFEFQGWFQALAPFELGILAAAQLPRMSVQQMLSERVDPFVCLGDVLDAGSV